MPISSACTVERSADHAHKKGIVLKGDIPIGISRNSCDAWAVSWNV
jgi:4-alpha-glucanotransferase